MGLRGMSILMSSITGMERDCILPSFCQGFQKKLRKTYRNIENLKKRSRKSGNISTQWYVDYNYVHHFLSKLTLN